MQPPPPPPPPPPPQPIFYPAVRVEEGTHSPERTQQQLPVVVFCLNVAHNLTQLSLGAVIISAFVVANTLDIRFSTLIQHIQLCTIGYFILMTQAIISYSSFGWANNLKYENKKIIHTTLQILGSILAIAGSAIQIANNNLSLDSAHGICGFIAMIFTTITFIGGIFNFIFSLRANSKCMKILHSCMGIITISFAFIALIYAFHLYYRVIAGDSNANLSIVVTTFAFVGTVLIAAVKTAKRVLDTHK